MTQRLCDYCRQPFAPKRPHARFDKASCRAAWHKERVYKGVVSKTEFLGSVVQLPDGWEGAMVEVRRV